MTERLGKVLVGDLGWPGLDDLVLGTMVVGLGVVGFLATVLLLMAILHRTLKG